jgi:2-haloalkanoic acid dehalogenase type II
VELTDTWPKAILLDFYGTVVEEIRLPVREICRRISAASPTEINEMDVVGHWAKAFIALCSQSFGGSFQLQKILEQRSLQEAFDYFKISLDSHSLSRLLSEYRSCPALFPESRSVLSLCRIPICLLTNIDNREIRSAVAYHKLHFTHIVTSEDCRAYKPRPETFQKALSRLGLPPQAVLHVGDSLQSDIRGARELGIPVLWINRREKTLAEGDLRPEYTSPDLTGLLEVLK